ncbi:MAG: hypothetical protein HKL90_06175 [Elusimicrobia bacterium]|nr:hypothetical protein [Elusimicrobiota bacterium]
MKKTATKTARARSSGRRTRAGGSADGDRGWNELEVQHDRLKTDWMSLAVQLGVGGGPKLDFE